MKTINWIALASFAITCWGLIGRAHPATVPDAESARVPEHDAGKATLEIVHQDLLRLRTMVEEHHRKFDLIFTAFEPEIAEIVKRGEEQRAEHEADVKLALETVCEITNENLTATARFSPTENTFAAIARNGGIVLHDAGGKVVRELRRPGEICKCIAYAPDGRRLLAGTRSGNILLWDLATGTSTVVFHQPVEVSQIAWLPRRDRGLFIVNVPTRDTQKYLEEKKTAPSVFVFDIETGRVLLPVRAMAASLWHSMDASGDGKQVAVLDLVERERGAYLLDAAEGTVHATLCDENYMSGPLSVCIAPDNNTVAVGYAPFHVSLWDGATARQTRLIKAHSNWVVTLAFSPDSRRLISGAGDSTARVWDVATGSELGRIRFPGQSTYVHSVAFSHDGRLVLAAAEVHSEGTRLVVCKAPRP